MVGTWQPLLNQPNFNAETMLLLTDGTVMCHEYFTNRWHRLTPYRTGNYVNGTWSSLQSMADNSAIPASKGGPTFAPLYFASAVLADGTVFVAGGEDNNNIEVKPPEILAVEVYDPVSDRWTIVNPPTWWIQIGDAPSCILPDGRLLLGSITSFSTAIYDPNIQSFVAGANKGDISAEETFTLLPNNTVLTIQCSNIPNTERYLPDRNQWISDHGTPSALPQSCPGNVAEIGPAVLLPDGRVFAIGATGNTALYTPALNRSNQGSWTSGPTLMDNNGNTAFPMDAPAVLLPNGKVLCVGGPSPPCDYPTPTIFFEYDPVTNTAAVITSPHNGGGKPYNGRFLLLPSGQVLFSNSTTNDVEVYTPDGQPNAAWKPTIINCPDTMGQGHTYSITGTQFNGLSQACSYGDDAQMATNYPIIRLTNKRTGTVTFLRTFNHSTMAVATGNTPVSTDVQVPVGMPTGQWSLVVIANGIESNPFPVTITPP
jgi:Kelch motif protein